MANLCNGTQKIEITSGMHIGNSYDCPGCDGCKLKNQDSKGTVLSSEEVIKNLRERKGGGWKD